MKPVGKSKAETSFAAAACWYLASLVVALAAIFGAQYVRPRPDVTPIYNDLRAAFTGSDGHWYAELAERGYLHRAGKPSNVVFYPAYPLLGAGLSRLTGLGVEWSLLVVSQLAMVGACVVALAYVKNRVAVWPSAGAMGAASTPHGSQSRGTRTDASTPHGSQSRGTRDAVPEYALLALLLFPTSMFARMAYTEALFLFASAVALFGMQRRWPLWTITAIVGGATATRAVGAALVPVLMLYIATEGRVAGQCWAVILRRWCLYLPLACWGLAAFMLYLHLEFGDALASVKNTGLWRLRPPVPWPEHLRALATLEPLWSVYTPSSPAYWREGEWHGVFPFSLRFANPLYFLLAVAALAVGIRNRWLNRYEALFMALLLAIPYFTTSYSCCMAGMGRFVGAMLPLHLVLGHVLARLPAPLAALLLTLSGALTAAYAALFAAGYPIV